MGLERNCPSCNKLLSYTNKYTHKHAVNNNTLCKSCGLKNSLTPDRIEKMSKRVSGENNPMYGKSGQLNPFFGKTHNNETKKKIIESRNLDSYKSKEFKNKMSELNAGENNPMYGKSFYDIWMDRYGKVVADKKMSEFKKKQSKNSIGHNNPMYGKPSPKGSGNGWSGWYKGWFFRSIKELTYMIKIIERFNLKWENGEDSKYKIEYYDYKNKKRNYYPDFIIENKYLIEIKPKNLLNSDTVKRKKESAINFCLERGLKYKISTIENLSDKEILKLYNEKEITFIERYEKKFKEKYCINTP